MLYCVLPLKCSGMLASFIWLIAVLSSSLLSFECTILLQSVALELFWMVIMNFSLPFELFCCIRMTPCSCCCKNLLPLSAVPVKAYCRSLPPYLLHHHPQVFDCIFAWDPFHCNDLYAVIISAQLCWIFVMPFECSIGSGCWPHWHSSFECLGTPCGSVDDDTITRHNCLTCDALFVWRMTILFEMIHLLAVSKWGPSLW